MRKRLPNHWEENKNRLPLIRSVTISISQNQLWWCKEANYLELWGDWNMRWSSSRSKYYKLTAQPLRQEKTQQSGKYILNDAIAPCISHGKKTRLWARMSFQVYSLKNKTTRDVSTDDDKHNQTPYRKKTKLLNFTKVYGGWTIENMLPQFIKTYLIKKCRPHSNRHISTF